MSPSFDTSRRWVRITLVIVASAVLTGGVLLVRAHLESRQRAAVAEARLALQQELTLSYDVIADPTQQAAITLSAVRETLQQQLAVADRTGDRLAADRDRQLQDLRDAAAALRAAADSPVPAPRPELDPSAPTSLGTQLSALQSDARELAEALDATVDDVLAWSTALADLRRTALAFADRTSQAPSTTVPSELIEQWRAERAPLEAYREAAETSASHPGLAPLADAHRQFVEANLAWIDEAVALLEAGRLDTYNARLDEVFGGEDPFGFTASLRTALERSFEVGLLAELPATREQATALVERLREARRLAPIVLRPDDAGASPADTDR